MLEDQTASAQHRHHVSERNRLGVSARTRGEDQHQRIGGDGLAVRHQSGCRVDGVEVCPRRHVDHLDAREVQPVKQRRVVRIDQQQLAIRAANVAAAGLLRDGSY